MKQCSACYRLLPPDAPSCGFCGKGDLRPATVGSGEDFSNYAIYLPEITLGDCVFRIAGLINRGGCSTILSVCDPSGQRYALKVPFVFDNHFTSNKGNSASDIRNSQKYLQSEIANLKKITLGQFLQVHATGMASVRQENGSVHFPYILMELANTTVKHLIRAELRGVLTIPYREKEKMILDFVASLQSLHESRMVHRDLSPDNIFSVNRDGQIRYIVSDFGTSKHQEDIGPTLSSQILSHDFYLDPERITNRNFRYDERSDIWSAGVIISEIIAGNFWVNVIQNPLSLDVKMLDFIADILEPVIQNKVDGELYRILCRTVHRDPERRYQRISQLHEDLKAYFGRLPSQRCAVIRLPSVLYLNVFLTLALPLAADGGGDFCEIGFDGLVNLDLHALRNYRIRFSRLRIDGAALIGTQLYRLEPGEGHLDLVFRRDYFRRRYRRFRRLLQTGQGQLKIYFQIRLKYFRF